MNNSEEIDWGDTDIIDNYVMYIAQDFNGEWFGYSKLPEVDEEEMQWIGTGHYISHSGKDNPEWKETLIERPPEYKI